MNILIIILVIILFIGIIRVIIKPSETFPDLLMELLLIDVLFDIIGTLLENLDWDMSILKPVLGLTASVIMFIVLNCFKVNDFHVGWFSCMSYYVTVICIETFKEKNTWKN